LSSGPFGPPQSALHGHSPEAIGGTAVSIGKSTSAQGPEWCNVPRPKLTEPRAVSLGSVARRKLTDQGMTVDDAAWIASAVLDLHGLAEGMPYSSAQAADIPLFLLEELGKAWKKSNGDRDAAVGVLLDTFAVNHLPPPRDEPTAEQTEAIKRLRSCVDTCRKHGVDFGAAFLRILALRPSTDPTSAMWITLRFAIAKAITPADVVSREKLLAFGDQPDWWDFQRGYGNRNDYATDPTCLQLWLELQGARAAEHLLAGMPDLDLPDFLRLARALAYAFGIWPRFENHTHPEFFADRGKDFAAICRKVFEEADRRACSFEVAPDELRHVWLRFAWMAIDASGEWVSDDCRTRVVRAAADDIGRLRPLLRRAGEEDAEQLRKLDPHFRSCIFVLFKLGSLWQATKPLLLAFRATNARAIGFDLRYWPTNKPDDPPGPWEMIPRSLMNLLHHYMRPEQADDAQLDRYRTEFALFCLERLKTRERRDGQSEGGPVEADAAWREGFIQAARALCVNPKGKGHHVLNRISKNDPDDTVREVAAKAYAELRHQPSLPKGLSPRRAVFDAFWWLRQAHLTSLGLGDSIDQDGASQTREEEARRTTEPTSK